jgi:hypothetical protein
VRLRLTALQFLFALVFDLALCREMQMTDRWRIEHGDCRELLALEPECSFDSCVCDPPYHLTQASRGGSARTLNADSPFGRHGIGAKGFMGRVWDGGGIAFDPETWAAVLRVLKPGAHLAAFGGTRTYHRLACAIEDAGFEIRDSLLVFCHGSGFPKSKKLGAGIGTALKPSVEPIVLARKPFAGTTEGVFAVHGTGGLNIDGCRVAHAGAADLAAHESQVAAIKARGGSMEDSWKNSSDLSGASDVNTAGRWPPNLLLQHAPECRRVGTSSVPANPTWDTPNRATEPSAFTGSVVSKVRHANGRDGEASAAKRYDEQGSTSFAPLPGTRRDDMETVEQWECVDGCPVRELSEQSGETKSGGRTGHVATNGFMQSGPAGFDANIAPSSGCAARYFPQFQHDPELDDLAPFLYMSKPARAEKDAGLDHFRARSAAELTDSEDGQARLASPRTGAGRTGGARNSHPTVKSVDLLRWLVRLVTPAGGTVVDPFAGSGSCGVASVLEARRYVGYELNDSDEEPFVSIARARLHYVDGREFVPRESLRAEEPPKQATLFSVGGRS